MHLQNFIKIHQFVHKILSINEISTSIKGHNCWKWTKNIVQSSISTSCSVKNLIEIHRLIHKILSINKILTSIKGHNSVKNWPKIMCIRNNMDLIYINAYTKVYQNSSIWSEDIEENTSLHQSKAITLLFINEFSPFAIPNHSSLISMSMQNLKTIGQKLHKLESGNKALTEGRTLRRMDGRTLKRFGGYNIIPRHFLCGEV